MQKTIFILTEEANSDLEYLQDKLQELQSVTKSELEQIHSLINRCKMFANQAEIFLAKVKVK